MSSPAPLSPALLNIIAERTDLREGAEGVRQIITQIFQIGPVPIKPLAVKVSLPVPVLAAVRRELEQEALLTRDAKGLLLSERGLQFATEYLGLTAGPGTVSADPADVGDTFHEQAALDLFNKYRGDFAADVTLDQARATPECSIARAQYMHATGAIEGRNILILGDDDLISLAIASYAAVHNLNVSAITTLDIDERILACIDSAAAELGVNIHTQLADLRNPLQADLNGRFDVVQTDPPYTLEGAELFLDRALAGLTANQHGQHIFFSFGDQVPMERLAVERAINDRGLIVEASIQGFNSYEGAAIIGSTSRLRHLITTEAARPGNTGQHTDALYTAEVRPRNRALRDPKKI